MSFGPKPLNLQNILIHSLGGLIAGIIGSLFILLMSFLISSIISIPETFNNSKIGVETNALFPIILSILALIGSGISTTITYYVGHLIDNEKYKKNIIILGQLMFFSFLTYICITPVYIYIGMQNYEHIMTIFLFHITILTFGTSIILEILNNYRYVLTGIYGSFVGLFFSIIISASIFSSFSTGLAKLITLLVLLPIINFTTIFFKQMFEYAYYHYHRYTNQDQIGDIFYQIEEEEKQQLKEEEEKNTI